MERFQSAPPLPIPKSFSTRVSCLGCRGAFDLRRFGGPMSLHQFLRLPVSIFQSDRGSRRTLLAATAMSILSCSNAWTADGDDALMKKLERMERRDRKSTRLNSSHGS